jgi:hypothetical protein
MANTNLLKNSKKQKLRKKVGEIEVYNILSEEEKELEKYPELLATTFLGVKEMRILLSILTNLGEEVSEMSDEGLNDILLYPTDEFDEVKNEVVEVFKKYFKDKFNEFERNLDAVNDVFKMLEKNDKIENTLEKMGIEVSDLEGLKNNDPEVIEKITENMKRKYVNKQTKSKKTVKPKEKANSKRVKKVEKTVETPIEE